MSKEFHIDSLKRKTMTYKSSGLLLLLPIGVRIELHLGLLPWALVEVGSPLGSPQHVISELVVHSAGKKKGVVRWTPCTSLVN